MFERQNVNFRLSTPALEQIDKAAKDYGNLSRADVIRACIKVAFSDWKKVENVLDQESERM